MCGSYTKFVIVCGGKSFKQQIPFSACLLIQCTKYTPFGLPCDNCYSSLWYVCQKVWIERWTRCGWKQERAESKFGSNCPLLLPRKLGSGYGQAKDLGRKAGSGFSRLRKRIGSPWTIFSSAKIFPPTTHPLFRPNCHSNQPVRMFTVFLPEKNNFQKAW